MGSTTSTSTNLQDAYSQGRPQEHLRRQGLPVPYLPRIRQDPILMAILLLHPHPRDCPSYPHQATTIARPSPRNDGDRGGDREGGYRRRDAGGEGKEGAPSGEFAPQFRGGFGRGAGRGGAPPAS